MNQPSWSPTTHNFRFQLGEHCFFTRRLPIALRAGHFTDLPDDPDALQLPVELGRQVVAFVALAQPLSARLPRLSWHQRTIRFALIQYRHSYVRIEGRFEDYLARTFSGQARNGLKRKVRKYCERNPLPFREYRTPEEMREFLALARQLSARTYQQRLLGKGLPPDDGEWPALAARGAARGYLLLAGDRPTAFLTGAIDDGILLNDYMGFDPDYRAWSPGIVLQYFALESLFAKSDVRIFDFSEGEGAHKQLFATDERLCADLYHFPLTPVALSLFGAQAALHLLSRGGVHALERLRLKGPIKAMLRRAATPAATRQRAAENGHAISDAP